MTAITNNDFRKKAALAAAAVIAASSLMLAPLSRPAEAAFPGTNGRIAFESGRDGNQEIYAMNPTGNFQKRLTNNDDFDADPSVSADGKEIVFVSNRDGANEIYKMNSDGSAQTRLTNGGGADPSFSPDGSKIVFSGSVSGTPGSDIFVMNRDGSGKTRLTENAAPGKFIQSTKPVFSPDGTKIAYESNLQGNNDIWLMNADGSGEALRTFDQANDSDPSFSPDGGKIAFASSRDDAPGDFDVNTEIYTMVVDGSNQTRITDDPAFDFSPSFSPDGELIAFESDRGNKGDQIFTMNADGGAVLRKTGDTTSEGANADPSWGVNQAPVTNLDNVTTKQDAALDINVLANDTDADESDTLTVTKVFDQFNGTAKINPDGKTVHYTPNPGFSGSDAFSYTVSDGKGNMSDGVVSVTVEPKGGSALDAKDDAFKAKKQGKALKVSAPGVLKNDSGGKLTAKVASNPTKGTLKLNSDGSFSYTPNVKKGKDSFTYKASDGKGGTDEAKVNIKIGKKKK